MQACFFKLTNILPYDTAYQLMKDYTTKTFAKKGEQVVNMNIDFDSVTLLGGCNNGQPSPLISA